jgi:hypothetical protein
MLRLATLGRRLGGLMAAVVLAVFAFGPAADAAICGAEDLAASTGRPAVQAAAVSASDHVDPAHHAERGGACAHGHCHHGAPCTPDDAGQTSATLTLRDRLPLLQVDVPSSRLTYDLDRPPRA